MSTPQVSDSHLVFSGFLETLRLRGFNISTGHYLRMQVLLARVGPACLPQELKTLLCPIFATNEREQERFYEEFDSYFDFESSVEAGAEPARPESVAEIERQPPARPASAPPVNNRLRVALIVGSVLLAVLVGSYWIYSRMNVIDPLNFPTPSPTPTPELIPTPPPLTNFIFRNLEIAPGTLVRILIALIPLLLFALYELYRRLKQRQRRKQWNDRAQPGIPIDFKSSLSEVYDPDSIARLARLLRTRQRSGTLQLDLNASIDATVKALGFFSLREKSTSKPPEYLVLIDRAAFRDHQARLFYELVRKLHDDSVFVTCYFFEGDPRVSFLSPFVAVESTPVVRSTEAQQKLEEEARRAQRGATLEDLHDLYPAHRLLIFSEGEDLVDPVTLQTVDWIKNFAHWQERAILTPRPRSLWDEHEFTLRQQFVVMPATLMGLELVAESFAIREPVSIPEHLRMDKTRPPHNIESVEGLQSLRRYLGEPTFQWLCACAVHPQLQWDLTICLGQQFSTTENLFTEDNLLRLFSLSWFRTGAIPDAMRDKLVRELTAGSEAKVRKTIADLMARAVALDKVTESADVVRVPLPQEFESSMSDELFKRIRNVRDIAFKRFVQPPPVVLFLKRILPNSLQRLLFTPFGLRMGARLALAVLVSLVFWAAFPALASAFDFGSASTNTNTNTNTNVNTNINQFPSPTPTQSLLPTPSPTPSATVRPSPSPRSSPSPSPAATLTPRPSPSTAPTQSPPVGILTLAASTTTIRPGERVVLSYSFSSATNIIIVPQDGELESLNQSFVTNTSRPRDKSGTVVVQPEKTTTYIITADIHPGVGQPIQRVSREVTVTVLDEPIIDPQRCRPSTHTLGPLKRDANTIKIRLDKSCNSDDQETWDMTINIEGKAGVAVADYKYQTSEPDKVQGMRALANRGFSPAAMTLIAGSFYDYLLKNDQAEATAAIERMLKSLR